MPGGDTSYLGFEYQIYATVLFMLLQHKTSQFTELEVETAFGNDATLAEKQVDDSVEDSLEISLRTNAGSCHIQVKTKNRKTLWNPSEFREVLLKVDERKEGQASRTLLDLLTENQRDIFLFVTNGSVSQRLTPLIAQAGNLERNVRDQDLAAVRTAIVNSVHNDRNVRALLNEKFTIDILQRAYIIDVLQFEDIQRRINEILYTDYWVPTTETSVKSGELVDLIRRRMLRYDNLNTVTVADVKKIIGKPEAKLPYPHLVDKFVLSQQYQEAQLVLRTKHVLFITGEPGVGKTTIAYALSNDYARKRYPIILPQRASSVFDIIQSAMVRGEVFFVLDDFFGDVQFNLESTDFGNQFTNIVQALENANGRVKVILTSRSSVFNQARLQTQMRSINLDEYIVSLPYPDIEFKQEVLKTHLLQGSAEIRELINSQVNPSYFESLLHIAQFTKDLLHFEAGSYQDLNNIFERTRPSSYSIWIQEQSETNRLFLYVLLVIIRTNQFAWNGDVERVFNEALDCIGGQKHQGFGSVYEQSLRNLRDHQSRLISLPNQAIGFIHPQLLQAVETYLEKEEMGFQTFIACLIEHLANSNHPLDHSIAAMLCISYFQQLSNPLEILRRLLSLPYAQTRETTIRFGDASLIAHLTPREDLAESEYSFRLLYRPSDCTIDEQGHLIVEGGERLHTASAIVEAMMWKFGWFDEDKEPELVDKFNNAVETFTTVSLNPLERYKFAQWLHTKSNILPASKIIELLYLLSIDPISFVRETAAHFFQIEAVTQLPQYQQIFDNLCYDSHPYVKIAVLEEAILPYWRLQPPDVQENWLKIVVDMMNDPFVRRHAGIGLIDMAGSKYHYHAEHSNEEKQQWFVAVAPKLLEFQFEYGDAFDRLLYKFDEYFPQLRLEVRAKLLHSVDVYVKNHPQYAEEILFTVEKLIVDQTLTEEEVEITNRMINGLTGWGRSGIFYPIARNYDKVRNPSYREFVHRPFYNESPDEFLLDRTAIILGFLANQETDIHDLPAPLQEYGGENATEAIHNYIWQQDNTFKKLLIIMSFGHNGFSHIRANRDGLYRSKLIRELVHFFSINGSQEDNELIADALLRSGYYLFEDASEAVTDNEWFDLVNQFINNSNTEACKRICEIILAANIASSVHNVRTFLALFHRMLTHQNIEVSDYAFRLLDENFHAVWEEVLNSELPDDWKEEIEQAWLTPEFLETLLNRSSAYRIWDIVISLLDESTKKWKTMTTEERQTIIAFACTIPELQRSELTEIVISFYHRLGELLTVEQRKQIVAAVFVKGPARDDYRGRLEQIRHNEGLRRLFPTFDWSKYF